MEAREWFKQNPDWEFWGDVNHISHIDLTTFVSDLYDAGCKFIEIFAYEWTMEPVYEDDEFHPDILLISLPEDLRKRQNVLRIVNSRFAKLKAKTTYKESKSERLMYFFEPEGSTITVGNRKITWYT